jgi:uncharacterized protein (TIGR02611 family)
VSAERRPRPLVHRALIVVGGFALVAAGALLLVLPGPGLLLIAAGLGMLSLEFRWAARLRWAVVRRMERVTPRTRSHRILVIAMVVALGLGASIVVAVFGMPGVWPR